LRKILLLKTMTNNNIIIQGAKVNNLKNIDVGIPPTIAIEQNVFLNITRQYVVQWLLLQKNLVYSHVI